MDYQKDFLYFQGSICLWVWGRKVPQSPSSRVHTLCTITIDWLIINRISSSSEGWIKILTGRIWPPCHSFPIPAIDQKVNISPSRRWGLREPAAVWLAGDIWAWSSSGSIGRDCRGPKKGGLKTLSCIGTKRSRLMHLYIILFACVQQKEDRDKSEWVKPRGWTEPRFKSRIQEPAARLLYWCSCFKVQWWMNNKSTNLNLTAGTAEANDVIG